jgi:hypothetical protein
VNRSCWNIHGIWGEFEGVNATIIRGEEYDDLDVERFEQRVIPRGGAKNVNGKPTRIRLTGTIQESKGNIYHADYGKKYYICQKFNVELGIALLLEPIDIRHRDVGRALGEICEVDRVGIMEP